MDYSFLEVMHSDNYLSVDSLALPWSTSLIGYIGKQPLKDCMYPIRVSICSSHLLNQVTVCELTL